MQDNGGERELVLGNRQLLTIFFVAALLCGVFFAVGYVVGGNSAKSAAAGTAAASDSTAATTSEGKREEPQPQSATDTAASTAPTSAPTDTGGTLPAAEPRVMENPAAAGSQPVAPAQVAPIPVPAPPTKPATATSTPTSTAPATGIFLSVPEKGTSYWQVTAVRRPEADSVVKALREAKFPAILAESSNPNLFRVLVGPYRSASALADAKRKLTDLGNNDLLHQKY